jgi:ABC-type bacteriocin/lantibiotic exporter with double-glycine peptidase domain
MHKRASRMTGLLVAIAGAVAVYVLAYFGAGMSFVLFVFMPIYVLFSYFLFRHMKKRYPY